MNLFNNSEDKREYTIKIIPHQGEDVRTARLPIQTIKFGFASIIAGAVMFVGAFGYAAYGMFNVRHDEAELAELRSVNRTQQEQLTILAKKANNLQDEMEKLNQLEQELRQLTAIDPMPEPMTVNAETEEGDQHSHDGQGGPYIKPTIKNVTASLDNLEKKVAQKRHDLETLRERIKEQQEYMAYQNSLRAAIPATWPTYGDISSPYGLRWEGTDFHPGIDIANDFWTPIVATADGVVTDAGWSYGGYGNMVDIDHGNGIMTRYAHAQAVTVSAGQSVKRGDVIAYMGSTGFSTGPHLHYEVRVGGQPVDPSTYF